MTIPSSVLYCPCIVCCNPYLPDNVCFSKYVLYIEKKECTNLSVLLNKGSISPKWSIYSSCYVYAKKKYCKKSLSQFQNCSFTVAEILKKKSRVCKATRPFLSQSLQYLCNAGFCCSLVNWKR